MPLYEFDVLDGKGRVIETIALPLPVSDRNGVTIRRRTVPASVGICGGVPDPGRPSNRMLTTYKKLEQKYGNNRDFRRRIGHSPAAVKAAWQE